MTKLMLHDQAMGYANYHHFRHLIRRVFSLLREENLGLGKPVLL
ncbi:MAG: hypothetical protein ABTQ25_02835 [Nitrosomonas ureae]